MFQVFYRCPLITSFQNYRKKLYSTLSKSAMSSDTAIVLYDKDTKTVSISLRYVNENFRVDRSFNFHRKANDTCIRVLERMEQNISKHVLLKNRKNKTLSDDFKIKVQLFRKDDKDTNEIPNFECLKVFVLEGNDHVLKVEDSTYSISVNPPTIVNLKLATMNIMAGYLLYPSVLEVAHCDLNDTIITWYRSCEKFEDYKVATSQLNRIKWENFSSGVYTKTSVDDIGRLFKAVCQPRLNENLGTEVECISKVLVSAAPGSCPFERRQEFTQNILEPKRFRILTYNLLADLYADSDFSRKSLFPTCPPYALAIDYRKQLFIKEILGYNADLICLQEVDEKVFKRDLQPILKDNGISGIFNRKGDSTVSEGLATFYRTSKLQLKDTMHYHLGNEFSENPLFSDLFEKIKSNDKLMEVIKKRATILQASIFHRIEDDVDSSRKVLKLCVVGVTHLYFAPLADHIRLLQAEMCMRILQQLVELLKIEHSCETDISLVFCGDFNSCAENAVYRYFTSQFIPEDEVDWRSTEGEEIEGVSLSHKFELSSACGTPDYTNYTVGFNGCLDYIFYSNEKLELLKSLPMPSHEEVTSNGALPSIVFPSDHIALAADFEWKN